MNGDSWWATFWLYFIVYGAVFFLGWYIWGEAHR